MFRLDHAKTDVKHKTPTDFNHEQNQVLNTESK